MNERIFIGVFPTGISYADRKVERHGDYKKLAFLYFDDLSLTVYKDTPRAMAEWIRADAAKIQARRGEQYETSWTGQTITLGYAVKDGSANP